MNISLLLTNSLMQELRSLETSVLVDMLAKHSADYSAMIKDVIDERDYYKCKLMIRALIAEIESRKQTAKNTNTTDPNIILPVEN
jgi:hypothetical protein